MLLIENEVALPAESLHQFIRSRQSVRRFKDLAVSDTVVRRVIESAIRAPSAHNQQPWRFAVLRSKAFRRRVGEAMGKNFRLALEAEGLAESSIRAQIARSQMRIEQAPVAILLCVDLSELATFADPRRNEGERAMAMQSAALAGGYLLLAAHAEGLGGVWVCAPLFAPDAVRRALDLPQAWVAQAMLLIGYTAELPSRRSRLPLDAVCRFM